MKKAITAAALAVLTLFGCSASNGIEIGDSFFDTKERYERVFSRGTVSTFQTGDTYTAVITDYVTLQKTVEFSQDRRCLDVQGLTPVAIGDIRRYLGKSVGELVSELGEVHDDAGSGLYIPAYITEDGYVVTFSSLDDTIFCINKYDLLSGDNVDRVVL